MNRFAGALVVGLALLSTPASAQSDFWAGVTADAIGQAVGNSVANSRNYEELCLSGATTSAAPNPGARERVQLVMSHYYDSAHASDVANVSAFFSPTAAERGVSNLAAFSDPLARGGPAALPQADGFVRSGDTRTLAGLWTIRADSGETIGSYRTVFRTDWGRWRIQSIERINAGENASLEPYCHLPGDIEAHNAALAVKKTGDSSVDGAAIDTPAAAEPVAQAPAP